MAIDPVIAIVGRPNVGKSTLFNRIVGRRRSIVANEPGVTRDRIYSDAVLRGDTADHRVVVVDTGGFDPQTEDPVMQRMLDQTQLAMDEAEVVVLVVDGRAGLLPEDTEIARMLRRGDKKVVVAVNKIDSTRHEVLAAEFYALGLEVLVPISASHGRGIGELVDEVVARLPAPAVVEADEDEAELDDLPELGEDDGEDEGLEGDDADDGDADDGDDADEDGVDFGEGPRDGSELDAELELDAGSDDADDTDGAEDEAGVDAGSSAEPQAERPIRVAVIGRPNVGKSSLINRLVGEDRHLVSDIAGTTVDTVDTLVERGGRRYLFIDTAGIRRKRSIALRVEKFSVFAALKGLERSDVALLLLDASQTVAEQDAKVAAFSYEKGRAVVIVVSKWDTKAGEEKKDAHTRMIRSALLHLSYAPIVFTSAKSGYGLDRLFPTIRKVNEQHAKRIGTGELNRFVERVMTHHPPPSRGTKRGKIFYVTQIGARPPRFLVSVNDPELIHFSYRRYLVNELRRAYGFSGVPLLVGYRARSKKGRDRTKKGGKSRRR